MPRQQRYFVPGIPQHVVIRGVDRQSTFFAPDDYELFLSALGINTRRFGCAIHAYVLMTNHVHMLMTPATARAIPALMQAMGRSYVQAINRRYARTGTLWEGRYKASPVDADYYLLACQRYIELNPVRAGLVSSPGAYPFSSFRGNALGIRDTLLEAHEVFIRLGATPKARQRTYRRLFNDVVPESVIDRIRDATHACQVLGNEQFAVQIETMLGRRVRARPRGRPKKRPGE